MPDKELESTVLITVARGEVKVTASSADLSLIVVNFDSKVGPRANIGGMMAKVEVIKTKADLDRLAKALSLVKL